MSCCVFYLECPLTEILLYNYDITLYFSVGVYHAHVPGASDYYRSHSCDVDGVKVREEGAGPAVYQTLSPDSSTAPLAHTHTIGMMNILYEFFCHAHS